MTRWTRTLALALTLAPIAGAQAESAWEDTRATMWDYIQPRFLRASPTGGVVTAYEALESYEPADGVAVFRRLTENGDLMWDVTRPLEGQDFFGLDWHEYVADLEVGASGEVAYAITSHDAIELTMLEPDGTQRWSTSMSPLVGPNYDRMGIEVAPNGDLVVVANEGLWAGVPPVRFDVWRLDAATGSVLWNVSSPTSDFAQMAVDAAGNTYIMVSRTVGTPVRLERWDTTGQRTGWIPIPASRTSEALRCDADGRCVGVWDVPGGMQIGSIDASLSLEWAYDLPFAFYDITLMADGHVVLNQRRLDEPLLRFDRQGALVSTMSPAGVSAFSYRQVVACPNGNSMAIWAMTNTTAGYLCRSMVEERDATGALVATYEARVGPTTCDRGEVVALDGRANVYASYRTTLPGSTFLGTTRKLLFEGEQGTRYCSPAVVNSTGRAATVRAFGSTSVADNNLTLRFGNLPPWSLVLPIGSRTTGFVPMAGSSQGTLCLGGGVGRFDEPGEVRLATDAGVASVQLELTRFPTPTGLISVTAGEVWNFQAWYRDANPGSTSNFTDAVAVMLQ